VAHEVGSPHWSRYETLLAHGKLVRRYLTQTDERRAHAQFTPIFEYRLT
jgi:hypothetical protein